ncbi:hypothetical protein, partial [Tabrizicola sp.]|uniref:hypothetical protein n=1 Tax=Tabrizicola sp. TaxID=2005166 RepID=UPI00273624FA
SGTYTRNFTYDTAVPTVSVTNGLNRSVNAKFTITGTSADGYGIDYLTITQNKDAGGAVTVSGTDLVGTTSFTLSELPRNPAVPGTYLLADGEYVYQITARDLAGKDSVVATVTVRIDTSAPGTNTISAPASGQTGVNALSGSAYTFRGTTSDAGVGMAKAWYQITSGASAPGYTTTPSDGGYTEVATSGNWSFTDDLDVDGGGADTGRAEGKWYLHAIAEDSSANRSVATSVEFDIDQGNPSLTEVIGSPSVVNRKASFGLSGTSSDTRGVLSVSVTQKKDEGSAIAITTNGVSGTTSWSLGTLPRDSADIGTQALVDGLYEYVVTVTDLSGKTTSLTRTVRFDATGPTVTVTNPAASSWSGSADVTVNGISSDLTGVRALYYVMGASEIALPGTVTTDLDWTTAGWTKASGTTSWTASLTSLAEDSHTIWLRAVDTSDNVSSSTSRAFGVDLNKPSLTSSTPSANVNVGFGLSGTSSDDNAQAIVSVSATQKKGAGSAIAITTNGVSGTTSWSLGTLPRDTGSIGAQLLTSAADGEYEYVITVTDAAGKTESVTRTVRYDITDPTATISAPTNLEVVGGTSYTISGTAADTSGSGVTKAQYSFTNNGSDWQDATGTSSWSATVALSTLGAEGAKTLYVQALDNAGNVSDSGTYTRNFTYDTAVPTVSVTNGLNRSVNAKFTITGTSADGYGIDYL